MVHQLVQQIHFPEHHMARIKASHDLDQCSQIITYWLESRWRINPFMLTWFFIFFSLTLVAVVRKLHDVPAKSEQG